jgi:hypothetical protein
MSTAYDFVVQFPIEWKRPVAASPPHKPLIREDLARLRAALTPAQAAAVESGAELLEATCRVERASLPTMVPALDHLLGGGLPKGSLVELSARRSSGRFAVVLSALAAATSSGEAAALIDHGDNLDPQAAEEAGIDLPRLLWVRAETMRHAASAAEMLIATGFPLVVIDCGMQLRGRRINDAGWLRLARAAAAHRTALLLSTPFPLSGMASNIAITIESRRAQWRGSRGATRILLGLDARFAVEKCRRRKPGEKAEVKLKAG